MANGSRDVKIKLNHTITIDDKSKYCSDSCTHLASYEACFSGYYCRLFGSLLERNEKENKWIRCGGCTWKVGNNVKLD